MNKFDFINNFADAACVFSKNNQVIFRNKNFVSAFQGIKSSEKLKKRFNFNWCFLSSDNIKNLTPIDVLLNSKENFHTICTFQKSDGEFVYYYIYSFYFFEYKIVIFKDISVNDRLKNLDRKYIDLEKNYKKIKESTDKFYKLQEHAQSQVLKMGIINRISLVIRETNDMETILASALNEIHDLLGAFKTYFSIREKSLFKVLYSIPDKSDINTIYEYEDEINMKIKNKDIILSPCLKEYANSSLYFSNGVSRIIIPVYNKTRLLGIIVTLTKQKVSLEDNREILQSVSVQLSSSIIQSGLITQLNKKNKKLQNTLNELKETQLQLINSEKMASLGQMVSGVAHEINTPLASINSNSLLIKKILNSESDLSKDKIDIIRDLNAVDIEAAGRISYIVKSLKRFVRLDEAEFQLADINKELDLNLKLLEHETKNSIDIKKCYSNLPKLYCSINMLNQVFMNILINACHSIKSTGHGGVITVTTLCDEKNLIVKIKNDGPIIPDDIAHKIFNAGYTTKKTGTGLGLAISKKIVELHKGSISFVSNKNSDTEFLVSIPLVSSSKLAR